jgi:VIT1/CCC1 family predicted Fe2+/Mn2+ transporter
MPRKHTTEMHRSNNTGWLRAAVLGANDGIVSTASLLLGVAAAGSPPQAILLTGIAGLFAGALSMAAGEFVSVSSQADTEEADLAKEREELKTNPEFELEELAQIYVKRGVELSLARKVSAQLMEFDALGSHAREELGLTEELSARPIQAAISSAAAFSLGAVFPLLVVLAAPGGFLIPAVSLASLLFLTSLGALAAKAGGASAVVGGLRVGFWGALAMGVTFLMGSLFGAVV